MTRTNVLSVGGHKTVVSLLRGKGGCTNIFVFCGSGMDEHVTSVRSRENGGNMQAVNPRHTHRVCPVRVLPTDKTLQPPIHIKFGLVKHFVKALDRALGALNCVGSSFARTCK